MANRGRGYPGLDPSFTSLIPLAIVMCSSLLVLSRIACCLPIRKRKKDASYDMTLTFAPCVSQGLIKWPLFPVPPFLEGVASLGRTRTWRRRGTIWITFSPLSCLLVLFVPVKLFFGASSSLGSLNQPSVNMALARSPGCGLRAWLKGRWS